MLQKNTYIYRLKRGGLWVRVFLFLVFLGLFFTPSLSAQSNIRLAGMVHDADTDEPLTGAVVEILDRYLYEHTNGQGYFEIQNIPPGYYQISVSHLGYREVLLENVIVTVDQINRLNIQLDPAPLESDSVLVVASPIRPEISESGETFFISRQEIEKYQAWGLPQLLQKIPGVQIDQTGGALSSYSIRIHGGTSKHVLVLLDGQRLNNPQTGEVDLNLIPLENIEEIELTTQGASSRYGAGAFDGVINFKTQIINNTRSGKIQTSLGSFSTATGLLNVNVASTNLGFAGSYQQNYSSQDFLYTYNDKNFTRENAWYQHRNIFSKLSFGSSHHEFSINYNFAEESRGLPSAFYNEMKHYDARAGSRYHTVLFNHRWFASSRFYLQNLVGYHSLYQLFINENQPKLAYHTRNKNSSPEVNISGNLKVGPTIQSRLGIHYLGERLEGENLLNPQLDIGKKSRDNLAVYGGIDWTLPSFQNILRSARMNLTVRYEKAFALSPEIYPSAGISVVPNKIEHLSFSANWGRAVRYPDFNSLFWKGDARARGNADLLPERKTFWNVSTHFMVENSILPGIYVRYFSEKISDLIFWQWTPPGVWEPRNETEVHKSGIDAQLEQMVIPGYLETRISYSFINSLNQDQRPNYYQKNIIFSPQHSLNTSVTGRYLELSTILSYRYISQREVTRANTGEPLKAYQLLDIAVNYRLSLKLINLGAGFSVRNLLNENYELIRGYPMPGQEFLFTLTMETGK